MRKYFWGFGLCGVVLTGGVVVAANHAARHPHSFIGRVMHGASFAASKMAPAAGFGPALASMQKKDACPTDVEGVPDDPAPVEEPEPTPAAEPAEAADAAPIVIPEDDVPVGTELQSFNGVQVKVQIKPVQHEESFGPATECPATGVCRAPAVMPRCEEDACETLPMPLVEVDEEEQEVRGGVGGASGLFRLFFQVPEVVIEKKEDVPDSPVGADPIVPSKPDECREDPHHHHHYSGCPYTGRMYRGCPSGGKPSCDPPKPSATGDEEASEEGTKPPLSKSALRRLRLFKARESIDDRYPTHLSVDTLEMRPSDRQLYEYGPGSL